MAVKDYTRLMMTQSPGWKLRQQQHSPNNNTVSAASRSVPVLAPALPFKWFTCLQTVTHPSINRVRHRATLLIKTNESKPNHHVSKTVRMMVLQIRVCCFEGPLSWRSYSTLHSVVQCHMLYLMLIIFLTLSLSSDPNLNSQNSGPS